MIVTVTLNTALDLTYYVDALVPHAAHRVRTVYARAGGKGLNVARVLAALGEHVVVTGLVGGQTGRTIRSELATAGLADATVTVAGESRRTVNIVTDGDATIFNEPGPRLSAAEWRAFTARFAALAADADVVTLSGSLPSGLPATGYAELIHLAREAGAWTLADVDGEPLRAALAARPDAVTPNAAELAAAVPGTDPPAAVEALRRAGAGAVIATLGPEGVLAATEHGTWRARPHATLRGNPTGAGDACAAALAAGHLHAVPWPDRIRDAVALSSAAVLAPVAGQVDLDAYRRLRPAVVVEDLSSRRWTVSSS